MLVDDEPAVRRSLARILRSHGFSVHEAENGQAALAVLEQHDIDTVVSDVVMPGLSGLELMTKAQTTGKSPGFVLVTGQPSIDSAMEAHHAGAARYMLKPVHAEDLRAAVRQSGHDRTNRGLDRRADAWSSPNISTEEREAVAFGAAVRAATTHYKPVIRWSAQAIEGYEASLQSEVPGTGSAETLRRRAQTLGRQHELGRSFRTCAALPLLQQPERGNLYVPIDLSDFDDEELYDRRAPLSQMAERVYLQVRGLRGLSPSEHLRDSIARLRTLGFRFVVDGFGPGFNHLDLFACLRPDIVKLDASLVRGIHHATSHQRIVRSVHATCAALGIELCAAELGDIDECVALADLGCDLMQGPAFGKPSPTLHCII